jgi:major membrane immunogen (membrane-anchored lipoprotein)
LSNNKQSVGGEQMKKLTVLLIVLMAVTALAGCAPAAPVEPEAPAEPAQETASFDVADGVYYAQEAEFAGSGWKYNVTLEVADGKIVDVNWNGTNVRGGDDKKTLSANGGYGMVAYGAAQSEWDVQAEMVEQYLLDNQTTEVVYTDDEGHTDAITGVSIHVTEFFNLVDEALVNGAVAKGDYTDGYYYAELAEDDKGFTYLGQFQVVNGTIVGANLNAKFLNEEEKDSSKKELGDDYGMVANGGAQAEWYAQAEAVEAFILANQGLDIVLDAEGKTDAVAGASIHLNQFVELFNMTLGGGETAAMADGVYYAQEAAFAGSGWKYNVTLTVENEKIVDVNWNGTNVRGGDDKKTTSESGAYGMVAYGNAQSEWDVQAKAVEQYLLDNQTTEVAYTDDEGHTDAITGVSIHVTEFFGLVDEALVNGPVAKGDYTDGYYYAELAEDDKGFTYLGQFQVVNGTIVGVNFNSKGKTEDGEDTSKKELGDAYGMVAYGGAQAEWFAQAATIEAFVMDTQDLTLELDADGKTDAVAGASIGMTQFVELFNTALK